MPAGTGRAEPPPGRYVTSSIDTLKLADGGAADPESVHVRATVMLAEVDRKIGDLCTPRAAG